MPRPPTPSPINAASSAAPSPATAASSAAPSPATAAAQRRLVTASALLGLAGALLLLLALHRPLLQVDFTVDHLVPELTPASAAEVDAAWRGARPQTPLAHAPTSIAWQSPVAVASLADPPDPTRVAALRASLMTLGPSSPGGFSAVELARFMLNVEPQAAADVAAAPGAPTPLRRLRLLRGALATLIGVGLLAALIALYSLVRGLRALDSLQVAAQGALGLLASLLLGTLWMLAQTDAAIGRQLVDDGLVMGFVGGAALVVSASVGASRAQLLRAPLIATALLTVFGTTGYLYATL